MKIVLKKMGMVLLVVIAVLAVAYGIAALLARPIPDQPFFGQGEFLVIAHQGGNGLWPDNTLYAFEHAVALGVDELEMDIHSTQDGVLVVIHDDTVDRTTDGTGPVQGFTLAELQALDAAYDWTSDDGVSFPHRGQGITIPTVEEVFTAFPDTRMVIEIKQTDPSIVDSFCSLIREHGKTEQVVVASFDAGTIKAFRRACPEVATSASQQEVMVFYGLSTAFLGAAYSPPAEAMQVPEYRSGIHVTTRRFVNTAHRRNVDVHVWTVNDVEAMQRLIDLGVDGIITDYPDRLLELLGR